MASTRKLLGISLACSAIACAADPALLSLVMPDARAFGGINVERIAASRLGKDIGSKIQGAAPEVQKILDATGFDPVRDLKEILIAATGKEKNGPSLFLFRGTFDAAKIRSFASGSGQNELNYQGVPILSNPAQKSSSMAFLDDGIVVGGDLDQVKAAIRRRTQSTSLPADLAGTIATLSERYDIWFHASGPLVSPSASVSDARLQPATDLFKSIQQVSGGVKFSSGVDLAAELVTRSEKDAASVLGALQLFGGFLTANQRNRDGLPPDALKLSVDEKKVRIALTITEEQLKKAYEVQMARHATAAPAKPRPADAGLVIQSSDTDMGTVRLPAAK